MTSPPPHHDAAPDWRAAVAGNADIAAQADAAEARQRRPHHYGPSGWTAAPSSSRTATTAVTATTASSSRQTGTPAALRGGDGGGGDGNTAARMLSEAAVGCAWAVAVLLVLLSWQPSWVTVPPRDALSARSLNVMAVLQIALLVGAAATVGGIGLSGLRGGANRGGSASAASGGDGGAAGGLAPRAAPTLHGGSQWGLPRRAAAPRSTTRP